MGLDPVSIILDIGSKVIDRIWPDPAAAASAKLELFKMQQSGELAAMTGQLDVNKIEAASASVFVSGWRPFVGWVCGSGLAIQYIVAPMVTWLATLAGHPVVFPNLDMGTLITLLGGLLGMGALRTVEKLNGVAAK